MNCKRGGDAVAGNVKKWRNLGVRESNFSLEYREIRQLAVFGPRRKDVLRGAGYAWTPIL